MPADELEHVRRFQRGDVEAFETLYRNHGDRVYRICFRLCGSRADAEDLAQEVFLAAYQGLERFEHRSSMSTWLYRIAMHCWSGQRRKKTLPIEHSPVEMERAAASDEVEATINRMSLESALAELSEDMRLAVMLVKIEGLKYREAAEVLGVPQGTIQFRVHEAMQRLRAKWDAADPEGNPIERRSK